jgi:hypothetical protein
MLMRSFVLRLMVIVVVIALLAACGSDDKDDSPNVNVQGEVMTSLAPGQLVGQWMNTAGDLIEFHRDGSISGYTRDNFVAATYTVANSNGETLLLLNTSNGSVYAREFTLSNIKGCDSHAFTFMARREHPDLWWFVGSEDSDSLRASELSAHVWRLSMQPTWEMEFQSGGNLAIRMVTDSTPGPAATWALENDQVTITLDGESITLAVPYVSRCEGRVMIAVLDVDGERPNFLYDPSLVLELE